MGRGIDEAGFRDDVTLTLIYALGTLEFPLPSGPSAELISNELANLEKIYLGHDRKRGFDLTVNVFRARVDQATAHIMESLRKRCTTVRNLDTEDGDANS